MPPPSTNNSKGNNGESSSTTGGSANTGQTTKKQQADDANDEQTGKKNMNGSFFFSFCIFASSVEKKNKLFIYFSFGIIKTIIKNMSGSLIFLVEFEIIRDLKKPN